MAGTSKKAAGHSPMAVVREHRGTRRTVKQVAVLSVRGGGSLDSPVAGPGAIYVSGERLGLGRFDARSLRLVWRNQQAGAIVALATGKVVLGRLCDQPRLRAFAAHTGEPLWDSQPLAGRVWLWRGTVVVTPSEAKEIQFLDTVTGRVLRAVPRVLPQVSHVFGDVALCSRASELTSAAYDPFAGVDLRSGAALWQRELLAETHRRGGQETQGKKAAFVDAGRDHAFVACGPAVTAYSVRTGHEVWRTELPQDAAVPDELHAPWLVATAEDDLVAINATSGRLRRVQVCQQWSAERFGVMGSFGRKLVCDLGSRRILLLDPSAVSRSQTIPIRTTAEFAQELCGFLVLQEDTRLRLLA